MSLQQYIDLPSGTKMPILGLGTWQIVNEDGRRTIDTALDMGYKLIDTANLYTNEKIIGQVLKAKFASGKIKREDIFITSKLAPIYMGSRQAVSKGMARSLRDLNLKYVDLFLIHFPVGLKLRGDEEMLPKDENGRLQIVNDDIIETWKGLEDMVDQGKAKAIGLSNFNSKQIERIRKIARYPIANIQVEIHAYFQQNKIFDFCKQRNITVTAYYPLGSPGRPKVPQFGSDAPTPLIDPAIKTIANKRGKTPAQVLLRNLMQRGIAVVPKSATPSHMKENLEVFDFRLKDKDMKSIAKLDKNLRLFQLLLEGDDFDEYPMEWPWKEEF